MSELNDFVKEAADRFLPLLGDDIQLASFFARDVFPPDVSAGQIDDIVSDVFNDARERMATGGVVFLRTGNAAQESETGLSVMREMPSYIALTVELTVPQAQTRTPGRPEALLRRLGHTVEPTRGFICFNQIGPQRSIIEV